MPFNVEQDDEPDLDELFEAISIPDSNMYIADEEKAVELISHLIKNKANTSLYLQRKIEKEINDMFSIFSGVAIENEMEFYRKFMNLCSRLSAKKKNQKLQDKVVISFGGKVSAGKSKFINAISGIGDKLPVDQKTTTAIPTYIIKSTEDSIHANSVYGYSTEISSEALNAMAHEFFNVYGIGFPAFVDSIIIESNNYRLSNTIALLDTPGYTKYDYETNSKRVISDRQKAYNQLRASDYLIWLIDIDSGTITEDDIQFIESLYITTPILVVFTKADLKSDKEIEEIIEKAKDILSKTTINCFGITAYSSNLKMEYGNNEIQKFFNKAESCMIRNNDIISDFLYVENDMREAIIKALNQYKCMAHELFSYIQSSEKIMEVRSLAMLWGKSNQDGYNLEKLLKKFDGEINKINEDIGKYLQEGKEYND